MKNNSSNEISALIAPLSATVIGTGYYLYIRAVDFPTEVARAVPFLWLILAATGLVLAIRVTKKSYISFVVIALSIPSLLMAIVFALAAMAGD